MTVQAVLRTISKLVSRLTDARDLFAHHPGRRCKPRSTHLFSRHPGTHRRPLIPRLAFPMLSGVFLAGCAGATSQPEMPPPAYGDAGTATCATQAAGEADLLWWQPVAPGAASMSFALAMLGMWIVGPMLAQCFVDWLRDRKGASR